MERGKALEFFSCFSSWGGKHGFATGQTSEASCTACGAGKYRLFSRVQVCVAISENALLFTNSGCGCHLGKEL
jgi:hypothetical protein